MKPNKGSDTVGFELSAKQSRIAERMNMLGIAPHEMTESVTLAVSALLEKLEDTNRDLARTKEKLAEMEYLVDVDCVATIPNRRAFMRRLTWAITMHERYRHPSTILYFDLNEFKALNDNFGHAAGDLAIRHVAQLLTGSMRESDFLARIGGDEFAIIMYYADEQAARRRGELLVDKLSGTPFHFAGRPIVMSAACGVYTVRSGDDAEGALAAADMSMYVDKRRNKLAAV